MRRSLLFLIVLSFFSAGCSKILLSAEDKLVGSWVLLYAEKKRLFEKKTITTGYEEGVFYFYENGEAVYDDGINLMQGNWQLRRETDGYYDYDGNYHPESRQVFSVHLVDFQSNRVLDWYFDDCWFTNRDRFTTQYESYSYRYRYVFAKQ